MRFKLDENMATEVAEFLRGVGHDAATVEEERPATPIVAWISDRALELVYTAHDLAPFARACGSDGPPFRWDPERRFQLRCELDAAFFLLFGISRDDGTHILDTFPIARRNDETKHGSYRTMDRILQLYDQYATNGGATA